MNFTDCTWISASTRAVYEKKLRKLLQSAGEGESKEADNAVLYSDSDEEDVSEKDEEKELGRTKTVVFNPNIYGSFHTIIIPLWCFFWLAPVQRESKKKSLKHWSWTNNSATRWETIWSSCIHLLFNMFTFPSLC